MSLWQRLKSGLKKTTDTFNQNLKTVFSSKKINSDVLDELEEALIMADMGVNVAANIRKQFQKQKVNQELSDIEIKEFLAEKIAELLQKSEKPFALHNQKPHVMLVIGVNGAGKTTTISKIAKNYLSLGKKVEAAACDTFRAAAVEQLKTWGERLDVKIHSTKENGDAAGLAYDAYLKAQESSADLLMIDTAGRLQNKAHLMDELKKIKRVLQKIDASAPHSCLLVLDATTGQNAVNQLEVFHKEIGVTGLVITKLDGTAKGGVVVNLADTFDIPIHYIGVGEQPEDLQHFTSLGFARNLLGIEKINDAPQFA